MQKGTIVKLSQEGLEWLYKNSPARKERAKTYRYEFHGYPRNKSEREYGIVRVKRLTSYSFLTLHESFLEVA